ncbi:hypothetical protein YYC_02339 [Plasmodium yoelii 17X]|uniref:Integral membrane protein n=4 Tax=Plasmodium yoelii TaxID=5861 RepID=Q7RL79_PLAYO|nr:early transcribed membrane protein [Plasmodium yoelii]EAA22144.1 integral membrane protein [Plasmodium yoelii yoelii]ETB60730.1 hypothetical protein YYC_02339 [Plasmodium yoelii 17X]WBY54676.1 early transcribed membrane protein [Plasmodium yoelii yoelii]CDU16044.1 early transcribed membrane protein [Plasmodium yoelii]VTZ71668.1 early transcribed membrane protein [Plasmodium yoelii]|eukprot:XP_730579.1 early transcribed membrane protein [Plasmodium yoelii]
MKVPKVSALFLVFLLSVSFLPSSSLCDPNAANTKIPNIPNPTANAQSPTVSGNSIEQTAEEPNAATKVNNVPVPEKKNDAPVENKDIEKVNDQINAKSKTKPLLISAISAVVAIAIASALGYGIYTKKNSNTPNEDEPSIPSTDDDTGVSEESNEQPIPEELPIPETTENTETPQ